VGAAAARKAGESFLEWLRRRQRWGAVTGRSWRSLV